MNDANGKPMLALTGNALATLQSLTPVNKTASLWLSLTDEYPYAQAQVIIEAV